MDLSKRKDRILTNALMIGVTELALFFLKRFYTFCTPATSQMRVTVVGTRRTFNSVVAKFPC